MGNKARRLQKIAERNANISTENDQPGGPEFAEEVTYEFDNSSVFIGLTDDSYEPLDIDSGSGPPGYIEILDADINSTIDNQIEADDLEADISVNSVQPSAVLNTVENINASSITNIDNQIQTFDSSVFETKLSVDTELSVVESLADATDSANTNVSNNIELIDEHPLDTKINLSLMANVQNRESINLNRTDTNSNGKLDVITSNSSNVQPLTSKELFESASELNSEDFTMDNIPIQPQYNENTKEAIIFTNDTNRANPKNDGSKIVESSELQIFSSVIISEQQLVNDKILNLTEDNLNIKNKERTSGKSEPLTNAVLNQVDNNFFLKDNITKNDSETISSQFASDLAELERLKPPEDLFDDEEDGQYSREFIVKEQEVVSDKDIQDGETILQEYGPSLFPLEILQVKELNNNNLTKINENDSADNILSEQNITESTNNSDISTTTLIQNDTTNTSFFEKERTGDSSNVSEIAKDAAFDNNGINEVNPLNAVAILVNNNDGELNISNSSSIIFNDSNHEINSSTNHINSIINSNKEIESNVSTLDDSSDGAQTNTFNDIRKSDPYKSNINLENKSLEGVVDNFPNNMNESSDFIETINDSDEKEFLPWADPININTAHNNFNQIEYNSERDKNDGESLEGERWEGWLSEGNMGLAQTPPEGRFSSQNSGPVKFEAPRVPVIFVLGGPGSGKVTHCDNLMTERKGITHINMTDLLQQYTISENKDFSQLSSKTVTEVLMLEMKMSPGAKTFLISGYPRSMRDVVEYSNKIQIVNGVVLVAWRQKVLERQIEYGAKLGHVVLSMAKIELQNFFKNVMPVADYFDQRGMLIAVNGERNPGEVYIDFRTAILRILGSREGGEGGKEIVAINGAANGTAKPVTVASVYKPPPNNYPLVIWVIGGPGSNKYTLCHKVSRRIGGWLHLSVGRLLRAAAEVKDPLQAAEAGLIKAHVAAGNLVPQDVILQLIDTQMNSNTQVQGILIDSFPRNIDQVKQFEEKYNQEPVLILLDCSKLQLGRGRMDDSVSSFRRRLELFREHTLPMLKMLDEQNRLQIVEGDTDSQEVREQFMKTVLDEVERLRRANGITEIEQGPLQDLENMLQDLEQQDEDIKEVGRNVAAFNPHIPGITMRNDTKQAKDYPIDSIRNAF